MLIGSIRCRKFTGRLIEKQICSEILETPDTESKYIKTISLNSNKSASKVVVCYSFRFGEKEIWIGPKPNYVR